MTRIISVLLIFLASSFYGQAQSDVLKFPNNPKLTPNFKKAIAEQTEEFNRIFYRDSATIKNYSTKFILDKIENNSDYNYLFAAEYWIAFHYEEIIPDLIRRVTNKKDVGLTNTADLIIWERVQSGQMKFDGHGGISHDDLFTVAGRANRLLTIISGENFGHVKMHSTKEQLIALQNKWIKWLQAL